MSAGVNSNALFTFIRYGKKFSNAKFTQRCKFMWKETMLYLAKIIIVGHVIFMGLNFANQSK